MKRRRLIDHLATHGCVLLREGARHSLWQNTTLKRQSAVPRHTEIDNILAGRICRDLGVPPIP